MRGNRTLIYSTLIGGVIMCIVGAVIVWYIEHLKDTHVIFLNVGQGDAILVTHGTHQVLIDGGSDGTVLQEELGRYMPFWDRTIDIVVATHPDSDHIDGLISIFKNYTVHQFWHTENRKETSQYVTLLNAVHDENGAEDVIVRYGTQAHIENAVDMHVWYPFNRNPVEQIKDVNDESVVIVLTVGEEKFYFGGDLSTEYEDMLPIENITVLKAGHHGSRESTSDIFLQKLKPHDVIISVGKDNRYGHPHEEVLERIKKNDANSYRTDEIGTIVYKCMEKSACQIFMQK